MLSHMQKPLTAQTQRAVRVSTVLCFCILCAGKVWAQAAFEIGVSVHLANDPGQVSSQLNLAGQAGVTSIREEVLWAEVERQKGSLAIPPSVDNLVNQALHSGFRPVLILDYGNQFYDSGDKPLSPQALNAFVRNAVYVTQHFKGRVNTYEMWNEWNGMVGNTHRGAAQDYVRFLQVVYPAVKAVDPSAVFIGGAIGGFKPEWLAAMAAAGGLRFCDALSIHPYNFDQPARNPDGWAQELLDTEGIVHRYTGGHDVPLYITEMGWPTYDGPGGSSPQEQATFLAQMFLLARTMPFLKGIWWYDLRDDGWNKSNKEDNFGLVDPNLKSKPAFVALRAVAPIVRGASRVERLPASTPSLHAIRFDLVGKEQVLALWNANPRAVTRVHVTGVGPLQSRSIGANTGNGSDIAPPSNNATVELSDSPVLITGASLSFNNVN